MKSNFRELTKDDWLKILKGAGISGAAAILVFLLDAVLPQMQADQLTLVLTFLFSNAVNALQKYMTETYYN